MSYFTRKIKYNKKRKTHKKRSLIRRSTLSNNKIYGGGNPVIQEQQIKLSNYQTELDYLNRILTKLVSHTNLKDTDKTEGINIDDIFIKDNDTEDIFIKDNDTEHINIEDINIEDINIEDINIEDIKQRIEEINKIIKNLNDSIKHLKLKDERNKKHDTIQDSKLEICDIMLNDYDYFIIIYDNFYEHHIAELIDKYESHDITKYSESNIPVLVEQIMSGIKESCNNFNIVICIFLESDTPESDTPESDTPESDTPESDTPESDTRKNTFFRETFNTGLIRLDNKVYNNTIILSWTNFQPTEGGQTYYSSSFIHNIYYNDTKKFFKVSNVSYHVEMGKMINKRFGRLLYQFISQADVGIDSKSLRDMIEERRCSTGKLIQFRGTCWLNGFLNALLLPYESRKIMIERTIEYTTDSGDDEESVKVEKEKNKTDLNHILSRVNELSFNNILSSIIYNIFIQHKRPNYEIGYDNEVGYEIEEVLDNYDIDFISVLGYKIKKDWVESLDEGVKSKLILDIETNKNKKGFDDLSKPEEQVFLEEEIIPCLGYFGHRKYKGGWVEEDVSNYLFGIGKDYYGDYTIDEKNVDLTTYLFKQIKIYLSGSPENYDTRYMFVKAGQDTQIGNTFKKVSNVIGINTFNNTTKKHIGSHIICSFKCNDKAFIYDSTSKKAIKVKSIDYEGIKIDLRQNMLKFHDINYSIYVNDEVHELNTLLNLTIPCGLKKINPSHIDKNEKLPNTSAINPHTIPQSITPNNPPHTHSREDKRVLPKNHKGSGPSPRRSGPSPRRSGQYTRRSGLSPKNPQPPMRFG